MHSTCPCAAASIREIRFQARLAARGLSVRTITTDGSSLYPAAIQEVFGAVPHQICQVHILHDVSRAILQAVARVRKTLAATKPKRPRGRPAKPDRPAARQAQRIQAKIGDLFTYRYLFVQRQLKAGHPAARHPWPDPPARSAHYHGPGLSTL